MISDFTFPPISWYYYIAKVEGSGEWFHIQCKSFSGDLVASVAHKLYDTASGAKKIQSALTNPLHCLWWFERLHKMSTVIHSEVMLFVIPMERVCVCRSLRYFFSIASSKIINKVRWVSVSVGDHYFIILKTLSFVLVWKTKRIARSV